MEKVVRLFAVAALLTAAAIVVADLIQHEKSGGPVLRSAFAWWLMAGPGTMAAAQGFVEAALGPAFWDPAIMAILTVPAVFMLALKAAFLILMATAVRD
jgi:hypothetical protein